MESDCNAADLFYRVSYLSAFQVKIGAIVLFQGRSFHGQGVSSMDHPTSPSNLEGKGSLLQGMLPINFSSQNWATLLFQGRSFHNQVKESPPRITLRALPTFSRKVILSLLTLVFMPMHVYVARCM